MLKKLKENKKGFTLVELIVVLVILAILAALLVPALTGYIDKAKRKSIVAETRQVVMAAQTLADEYYGTVDAGTTFTFGETKEGTVKVTYGEVKELAEVKGTIVGVKIGKSNNTEAAILEVVYKSANDKYFCKYTKDSTTGTDGAYNVTTTAQAITP